MVTVGSNCGIGLVVKVLNRGTVRNGSESNRVAFQQGTGSVLTFGTMELAVLTVVYISNNLFSL